MRTERTMGRNLDMHTTGARGIWVASAAAGTAADFERPLFTIPPLSLLAGSGEAGSMPYQAMTLRMISLVYEALITGSSTHYFTWNVRQLRGGAILINTTGSAIASTGLQTCTPAAMTNIAVGVPLLCDTGASQETVVPISVTATTFTAVFANTHSASFAIVSQPLVTIAYKTGTNEAAYTPDNLKAVQKNLILPGDVITLQRVSSDATGLAQPNVLVDLDFDAVIGSVAA